MLKPCTAPAIQSILVVLIVFLWRSPVARTEPVVPPDGSDVEVGALQSATVLPGSPESLAIDFNDLDPEEGVAADRYLDRGLRIEIGPSSRTLGAVTGSLIDGPCDGTRSMKTQPFAGPGFLLRFPEGVTSVSLDAGDIGPSDTDIIMMKAWSDDALVTIIGLDTAVIPHDAPTECVRLSVQAPRIKAVEITAESFFFGSAFYPNSIFLDNVTFEPAR